MGSPDNADKRILDAFGSGPAFHFATDEFLALHDNLLATTSLSGLCSIVNLVKTSDPHIGDVICLFRGAGWDTASLRGMYQVILTYPARAVRITPHARLPDQVGI